MCNTSMATDPMIDEEYLDLEPGCGEDAQTSRRHSGYRISNSLPSNERFPWAIKVLRTTRTPGVLPADDVMQVCSGSIISKQ